MENSHINYLNFKVKKGLQNFSHDFVFIVTYYVEIIRNRFTATPYAVNAQMSSRRTPQGRGLVTHPIIYTVPPSPYIETTAGENNLINYSHRRGRIHPFMFIGGN